MGGLRNQSRFSYTARSDIAIALPLLLLGHVALFPALQPTRINFQKDPDIEGISDLAKANRSAVTPNRARKSINKASFLHRPVPHPSLDDTCNHTPNRSSTVLPHPPHAVLVVQG